MNTNIIKGIDEVIKGLTTIKGALMAIDHAPIKEVIKEAVEEAIEGVVPAVVEEAPVEVKKVEKKAKVVEPEVEEEIKDEVEEDTEVDEEIEDEVEEDISEEAVGFDREAKKAELEEMKYNDLKALAGTLEGASAIGKKAEIIESILNAYEAMGGVHSEEETAKGEEQEVQDEAEENEDVADEQEGGEADDDESREEFVEFLESLGTDEIIKIAEQAGIKVGKKVGDKVVKKVDRAKLIEELVEDLDKLVEALEALGYYDEEDEEDTVEASEEVTEQEEDEEEEDEEEDEEASIAEKYGLNERTVEELADICADFGLSTKGKKQALIDRIVKGIMDGTIEFEDEDEEEVEEEEVQEVQEEKAPLKKVSESENSKVLKKEAEIEADIRDKYEKGKLKDTTIKKFLDKYNEGDPECAGCNGCSKEDMLDCYIDIHKALVDDDGDVNEFEEPYVRHGEYFCCGKEIKELDNGNLYCSVCGQEYVE